MALEHPGVKGVIVARDVPQLRKGTLVEFKKVLTDVMDQEEGKDFVHNLANNTFKFNNGAIVDCVGANNYDSAFRSPSYGWAWADECDYYKKEAWSALLGRLRTAPEQLRATSSPKGYNFIFDHFSNEETKSSKAVVVKATTFDNSFVSDDYRESLKESYSPRLYRQEVLGERLNLSVGAVYSEFDRDIHIAETPTFLPGEPIHIFLDYNVAHMLGMVIKFDQYTNILYIVDELHLRDTNSHKMVVEIQKRYPNNPIIITGDSSGNNKRDTAATYTNYQIFQNAGFTTRHTHNPPVIQRVITVESALYHKRIIINKSCTTLIRDLELMTWKENSSNNEIDKSDITLSHASDAFGYACYTYLKLTPAQKKSKSRFL